MTKPENSQSAEHEKTEETSHEQENQETEQATDDSELSLLQRIGELETAVAAAENEAQTRKDAALRAAAEAENVRRRAAQDVQKARDFALEKFATELLPVVDNLERALQAVDPENESTASLVEGIQMTHKSFTATLEKFGVEIVDPQGQPFNPEHHEAMGMQESEDHPANTVIVVMQKGYLLNGRLLRPAMVMVSRAPSSGVNTTA